MKRALVCSLAALVAACSSTDADSTTQQASALTAGAFLLGVDLGGPAVTVDGHAWASEADARAKGFSLDPSNACFVVPPSTTPAADSDTLAMLDSCYWGYGASHDIKLHQKVANGSYDVYLWSREDHASHYRAMDVSINGAKVASGIGDMALGEWKKSGPYTTNVVGGSIDLTLHATKGDPTLAGFAVYVGGGCGTGTTPTTTVVDAGTTPTGGKDAATFDPGPSTQNSAYVPAGYDLVFADEMNETKLDTSKWWTRYVYGGGTLDRLNDEQQLYREHNNHVMTGSTMKLMGYKVKSGAAGGVNYESGMLRSKDLFKYGYFETRVKMPPGVGMWPAFWLNAETGGWPPEIDIFEFVNNGVEDKANMLHTGVINHGAQGSSFLFTDPNFNTQWTFYTAPFNFPDAYHVVSLLWDANSVATYVDGKMIVKRGTKWVHDNGSDAGYAHVLLNLAMGGQWAGRHGIDDSKFPQGLEIDYVRVYQPAGKHDKGKSTIGQDLCPAGGGC
jgi:beta-glucanase (GH16 family)